MLRPRTISHMAMKMLRLLKNRRDRVSSETDVGDDGSKERKAEVDASRKIAMALATLRRAIVYDFS